MKTIVLCSAVLLAGLSIQSLTQKEKLSSLSKVNKIVNEHYGFVKAGQVLVEKDTFSVQSFLMTKGEVTNFEYQFFLKDLLERGEVEKYKIANIDSLNWMGESCVNQKYVDYYHRHPAYRNYPVVNISKEGAELFCEWATEKFNQLLPEGQKIKFRLPLKAEWLRASCGDNLDAVYTWKGPYLRNSKGAFLANFVQVGESSIARDDKGEFVIVPNGYARYDEYGSDIITASLSYFPNEFGIYNMNGNVAELLADSDEVIGGSWYDAGYDIRNRSVKKYTGSSPTVGFRMVTTINTSDLTWFKPKTK